ncbi:MAG TPA: hypothetical protein VF834_02785 [Streptosporangiaceae bacterium]
MSATKSELRPSTPRRRRRRAIAGAVAVVIASVLLVAGLLIVRALSWHEPQFAGLAAHPDRSLQGTVAYYADRTGCVRVVAAAGRPGKTVLCIPQKQDVAKAQKLGKEVGPQLVWLPGGRLEVTMFRMTPPAKPGAVPAYHKGWRKIIDVRTGHITNVPAAALPDNPNLTTHPAVSPSGQRITWTSAGGRVEIMLRHGNRSRVLLSVQGPPETYRLGAAFWAPNWQWIAADDGRILIITTGRHPVIRVLTAQSSRIVFEQQFARFAVTGANLLPASG